jgi:Polyketide cyclase / dehydrase and lipid transport
METFPNFGDTRLPDAFPPRRGVCFFAAHAGARTRGKFVIRCHDAQQVKFNKLSIASNCRPARRYRPLIALTLLCFFAVQAKADADDAIDVAVRIQSGEVIVDVNFHVGITPQEAWAVITDYDHATSFISKLERSVILSRTHDTLLVSQKGTMGYRPFSLTFETVLEIRLTPFERMQSRLISGNMKKNDATTTLVADASGTRVVYHLESIPDVWLPPIIGRALVEFETRARFRQLIAEMLRRKALPGAKR